MLKLHNTLSRKKEVFKPISNQVGFYGCGPTVYWYQHIGNLRRYVFEDILYRVLKFNEYKVKHIINVTDVGHLTSDSDEGEDKIEKAAKKEKKTAEEIAKHYFEVFKKDLEKLNIEMPDVWAWATKHIKEQIDMIKILEKKGYTYETSDGIYFDTSKVKDYGKLANVNRKDFEAGKRIEIGEKKNKTDFALWKFSLEPGKRQQEWDPKKYGADWKIGFPGWHVECSAMSSKYLGKQFDIHTGGIDHIPIHHTNEITQSESAFGKKPWVKYWIHSGFLNFQEGKLSKNKGTIIKLSDLEEKGYSPLDFRYLCLSVHYRKPLAFSYKNLDKAKESYSRLKNICSEIKQDKKLNKKYLKEFEEAINDDLNTPNALQVLWKLVRDEKAKGKFQTIKKIDEVLRLNLLDFGIERSLWSEKEGGYRIIGQLSKNKGLEIKKIANKILVDRYRGNKQNVEELINELEVDYDLSVMNIEKEVITILDKEIKKLAEQREEFRKQKNFGKADQIRDKIKKKGFEIIDSKTGPKLSKI